MLEYHFTPATKGKRGFIFQCWNSKEKPFPDVSDVIESSVSHDLTPVSVSDQRSGRPGPRGGGVDPHQRGQHQRVPAAGPTRDGGEGSGSSVFRDRSEYWPPLFITLHSWMYDASPPH